MIHIFKFIVTSIVTLSLMVAPSSAESIDPNCRSTETVTTLKETWPALFACYFGIPNAEDSEITLVFSLRRDGTLIGKPKVTAKNIQGNEAQQRAFENSVLEAIEKALPLPFSDSMGTAIAGRVLAVRIKGDGGWSVRY
ncbi:hypothetical protein [Phyllobacterium sp. K27]